MQDEAVTFFARFIEKELGIIYSDFNYFQLHNRLEEITKMRQLKSVDELLKISRDKMPSDLKQLILDVATNNETSFFRDPKLFDAIKAKLIPELSLQIANQPIKIWSAACSTGQEPYTLVMLMQECSELLKRNIEFDIFATDISSRVLEKAKKARFTQLEVQRGLPTNLLIKYFDKDETDHWSLKSNLANKVKFSTLNLLGSFSEMGKFDIIFCRNVLIYQNVENKKKIIQKLTSCMRENSYLILGAGESMIGLSEDFESSKIGDALFYRLRLESKIKSA